MLRRCRRSEPPWDRPLLSVSDRRMPMLRARGGHGRRGSTALQRGGDGHKLNWRVRPVCPAHVPRWQAAEGGAAACSAAGRPWSLQSATATACSPGHARGDDESGDSDASEQGDGVAGRQSNHVLPAEWWSWVELGERRSWGIGCPSCCVPGARPEERGRERPSREGRDSPAA